MKWNKIRQAAAALLSGAVLLSLSSCTQRESEMQTETPKTDFPIENMVENTGCVTYRENYSITSMVGGKILSCTFEEGDTVQAGDVLYTIDSGDLEDQITQARLSLSNAQAAYEQAVAACDDLTVRSNASGSITKLYVHVGDFVTTGAPVADLVDSQNLELTVPFAPADAALLTPGTSATISFPAQADTVSGTVKRVYDTPTVLSGGREGVYVVLSFQNPGALMSGASAQATAGGAACMEAGTVTYATEQSIYATQSGQVLTLPVEVGSAVTAGQTVMTIDNASLTNAVTNSALSVKSAQVNLAQLEAKRPDYTITAPVDGTILSRTMKTGDLTSAATPMATLAQPGALCVQVDVDELSIDRIGIDQQAQVSFTDDSGEPRSYSGTVSRIDDTGITSGGVTEYTVELTLEHMEGLRSGMNVDVSILTESRTAALAIPSRAVSGGRVTVIRDGQEMEVAVTTGISGGGYTEILEGLTAEDSVVLPS